jgi:hypothetical protein
MRTLNFVNQRGECVQVWWEGPGVYGVDTSVSPNIVYRLSGENLSEAQYCWDTFEQARADLTPLATSRKEADLWTYIQHLIDNFDLNLETLLNLSYRLTINFDW